MSVLRLLKTAAVYFGLVFGVGFMLGPPRVLLLEPLVGSRVAQLIESPIMLLAILVAGRWIGRRWCCDLAPMGLLVVGLFAAGFILAADLAVGVGLRGMSVSEAFLGRDPVAGPVYYGLVALTAVAPWMLGRSTPPTPEKCGEPSTESSGSDS